MCLEKAALKTPLPSFTTTPNSSAAYIEPRSPTPSSVYVETPILRPGMVEPILQFQCGIIGFSTLAKPTVYYVVITDNIDG